MERPKTEKQKLFCEYYMQCGKAVQAARMAGYKDSKNLYKEAWLLKKRFAEYIAFEMRKEIKGVVPEAYALLLDLARNAQHESVRLKALRDILDRAGMAAALEQHITIEHKSDEEIDKELQALLGDKAEEVVEAITKTIH